MKRIYSIVLICVVAVLIVSCSRLEKIPEEGIWYCDELKISIDFSKIDKPTECAKLYNEDGTHQMLECKIDFVSVMDFFLGDSIYLSGGIKFKDDKFILTTDKSYVFLKQTE